MCLAAEDLFDPLRDIVAATGPSSRGKHPPPRPTPAQVRLDRLPSQLGNGDASALSFMTQPSVEIVRQFHGRSLHVCQHTARGVGWERIEIRTRAAALRAVKTVCQDRVSAIGPPSSMPGDQIPGLS
jgi:hypothetical protein